MTETSYWWTTSGTPSGHQVSSYTQAHLSEIIKIVGACHGLEGVGPAYLNLLAGSVPAVNTARIASGGALVDGKPYKNDTNVDVNIPSAVGGGNTRIDRIVLRASWASFTVTITRIAGTDAASPTAPAITQTPGTTYDIMLYQALVNTSGTVTLTDERVWARVSTAELDANSIDNTLLRDSAGVSVIGRSANSTGDPADIAAGADGTVLQRAASALSWATVPTAAIANDAVDDTKVGNRVPQFYRRQGGDASDWSVGGTTTYTPTTVRMQAGSLARSPGVGGNNDTFTITFPTAFSQRPVVFFQIYNDTTDVDDRPLRITSLSATQVAVSRLWDTNLVGGSYTVFWVAIGAE